MIFATHNRNKLNEIRSMTGNKFRLVGLDELNITEDIEETGFTFAENAALKARFIVSKTGEDCIADDSGLEIAALNGEPGVFSARYAGEPRSDQKNMELVLHRMKDVLNRQARFVTVLCLHYKGEEYFFEGEIKGVITEAPRGNNGFGYDPIFMPEGHLQTMAEMSAEEKNAISHRAMAFQKLAEFLNLV